MPHRPAELAHTSLRAPPGLEDLRPAPRLIRRTGPASAQPRAGRLCELDEALRRMLETCPPSERLLATARRLADDDGTGT